MSREMDKRDPSASQMSDSRMVELRAAASEISDRLPGSHRLRIESFDPATGNPARVVSDAAPAEKGNYVQRALGHMQEINQTMGLTAEQPAEYTADPNPQQTSSGAVTVHLQQRYKGLPIFQAATAVRFTPEGALKETVGPSFAVSGDPSSQPIVGAEEAAMAAARHIAVPDEDEMGATDQFGEPMEMASVDLEGFEPTRMTAFADSPDQATVMDGGPFERNIKASLIWFPLDGGLRLSWEVNLSIPAFGGDYMVVVDAENQEVLYCGEMMHYVAARGNVFRVDGSGSREMTDFPRDLGDYDLSVPNALPNGFPDDWVDTESTVGNCVDAHLDASGPSLRGSAQGGVVTFDPNDPVGDDQKVLNIFYYNCVMHDYFYLLGFDETNGNFQENNLSRGGRPRDRVDARSHSGAVNGTANMRTPADGSRPEMNMGLVTSTNRHTAFDSSVVYHEFMHGVTNRLVGGPLNSFALTDPQSRGMGEGWGDYVACTINDDEVVGAWVVNRPNGIRGFRYDGNFPDGFGDLGTGRYTAVHNIGEIWCATLLEMNRAIGKVLGMELVVDALKLSPARPSFLDMRDAILLALDDKLMAGQLDAQQHATTRAAIWQVFARFGMGVNARSNGASLTGIVADTTVPAPPVAQSASGESTPGTAIPDRDFNGITDSIQLTAAGTAAALSVEVDIQHTWIGDLRVRLISPAGTSVFLHRGEGGSDDDLVRSYSSLNSVNLATLVGESVQGEWQLNVVDAVSQDRGTLRRWSIDIDLA